jgi:TolB-like protein/DNA-binding winged helix-turn-helix (wHTH) protein
LPLGQPSYRTTFRFDAFELDPRSGELRKHGHRIRLQQQPFRILCLLVERPSELITREEIREALWGGGTFVDFDRSLNKAMVKLRQALGDDAESPRFIETLTGRGYRFLIPVKNQGIARSVAAVGASDVTIGFGISQDKQLDRVASPIRPAVRYRNLLAVVLVACVVLGLLWLLPRSNRDRLLKLRPAGSSIQSLAMLPLENLSGDPAQDYFADGMTDELTTNLARIHNLRVVSRTSMMRYRSTHKSISEIARELNIDAIVEGSVVRSGNKVRITTQLIDARRDVHLWAQSYERQVDDILDAQDSIALDIAAEIGAKLTPQDQARMAVSRPIDPETHELYLKGIYFNDKETPDDVRMATVYFRKAIDKDHDYAAAYAGLAHCYIFLSAVNEMPTAEGFVRAKEAAEKAVALDDKLDDAHVEMAYIAMEREWDWRKAESEFQRALALNPNSARAHGGLSYLLMVLGRPQKSIQEIRAARALDPLSLSTLDAAVFNPYFRRQYDEALVQTHAALELYPNAPLLHVVLSNIFVQQGRYQLAGEETLMAEEFWGAPPQRIADLKAANEGSGLKGLWRKRIELNKKLTGTPSFSAFDIASDCAAVGDKDQALHWLEEAYRVRDTQLIAVGLDPVFDTLRSDPRFIELANRIGIAAVATTSQ